MKLGRDQSWGIGLVAKNFIWVSGKKKFVNKYLPSLECLHGFQWASINGIQFVVMKLSFVLTLWQSEQYLASLEQD